MNTHYQLTRFTKSFFYKATTLWLVLSGLMLTACGPTSTSEDAAKSLQASRSTEIEKEIAITQSQMKELAGAQKNGAVYMRIANGSGEPISVVSASSPVAEIVEIHRTSYQDGMMQMRQVDKVDIANGESFTFTPRSYHFMLMNVDPKPKADSEFPLVIQLADGKELTTMVQVSALR